MAHISIKSRMNTIDRLTLNREMPSSDYFFEIDARSHSISYPFTIAASGRDSFVAMAQI
jgi:hypothetical protein